ncbi:MAG: GNAT family N-acetyltransferase [Defluviitaleaceae bacterium]|nr:GNAT family N-acetyltransferase [Defluviitaleaceae bacterium]
MTDEIYNADDKSEICNTILRKLPDWFGVESSIADYVTQVKNLPFVVVFDKDSPVGFAALKQHTNFAAEICVMGVLPEYHRRGIGKKLINACEHMCRESKTEFLTVKTLAESRESKSYEKTRLF